VAGAAGAALISMVARLTVGKKGFEDVGEAMDRIVRRADGARDAFLELADRDAAAFDAVMAAFRLPKGTGEEKAARAEAIQRAFAGAAAAPLEIARLAAGLLDLALEVTRTGNSNAASDGAAAVQMLSAATESAIDNVEINLAYLKDRELVERMGAEVASLRARGREVVAAAEAAFRDRLASS